MSRNIADTRNYSRHYRQRLRAETLFDAVCDVTGVPEKFDGVPTGARAVQLWDSQTQHYFLKLFGRPVRVTACECERNTEASIAQVLHLLNSPNLQAKLAHADGRLTACNAAFGELTGQTPEQLVGHTLDTLLAPSIRQRLEPPAGQQPHDRADLDRRRR